MISLLLSLQVAIVFPGGTPDVLDRLITTCLFEGKEETPLMNLEGFCACCFEEEEVRLAPGMVEKWEFFPGNLIR